MLSFFSHKKLIPKLEFLDLSHNGVLVVDNLQVIMSVKTVATYGLLTRSLRVQKSDSALGMWPFPGFSLTGTGKVSGYPRGL